MHGSFLFSHQQKPRQGEAGREILSIGNNQRAKGIRTSAEGSLLHLLSRRQRSEANRWSRRR